MTISDALPVPALEGEQALLQSACRYLLTTRTGWGYNPINGELWLTNHRLIFKPGMAVTGMQRVVLGAAGAGVVWFPIRRVTECSEQPMKVQWGNSNVLRLQFDNGGREYFVLDIPTPGTWSDAITRSKASATALNYSAVPALKSGFEQPAGRGAQRMLVYWLIGLAVLCLLCSVVALLVQR